MSAIIFTHWNDGKPDAVVLESTRMLTLRDAPGTRVRCNRGRGWVTVEGDPADYWIKPGEEMQVRSRGRVVIETDPRGELQVTLPCVDGGKQAIRGSATA